jgi:EcoRII C terminal
LNLGAIFSNIAHKRLVLGELPHGGSNQHELNGSAAIKTFFNSGDSADGPLEWFYFADDQEPVSETGTFKFYDARAKSAARTGRSEWRFYYSGEFLKVASPGDWAILARTLDGRIFSLVFADDSAWLRAARVLFGLDGAGTDFEMMKVEKLDGQRLELLGRQIFEQLGIDVALPVPPSDEQLMFEAFGGVFPSTLKMSAFARAHSTEVEPTPDGMLLAWLDREEQLFRAMENVLIRERLGAGFSDVEAFISYSLSVQNRRKSRMGFALQNHLTELFQRSALKFDAQCRTEGNSKPDFIFPGSAEYHDPSFDTSLLLMLGAKASAKDRWRQILDEADRIKSKHLCTLEQGISTSQTDEMRRRQVTLVVPLGLHHTYTPGQLSKMLSVEAFISIARNNQSA